MQFDNYAVRVEKDSINVNGDRLTTLVVTFPRFILAEFNTHRMFSRNSASSRAIPTVRLLHRVGTCPFIPIHWGLNQKGMQAKADDFLSAEDQEKAEAIWLKFRDAAIEASVSLDRLGIHKQITNRPLELFLYHTVIVSATEWQNFFNQRDTKDAQPEFALAAKMMREEIAQSEPTLLKQAEWHLPFTPDVRALRATYDATYLPIAEISAARCARVSYLTHEGKRDPSEDINMYTRLRSNGHMSPLEHPAFADTTAGGDFGNFRGWRQLRKLIPNEAIWVRPTQEG